MHVWSVDMWCCVYVHACMCTHTKKTVMVMGKRVKAVGRKTWGCVHTHALRKPPSKRTHHPHTLAFTKSSVLSFWCMCTVIHVSKLVLCNGVNPVLTVMLTISRSMASARRWARCRAPLSRDAEESASCCGGVCAYHGACRYAAHIHSLTQPFLHPYPSIHPPPSHLHISSPHKLQPNQGHLCRKPKNKLRQGH